MFAHVVDSLKDTNLLLVAYTGLGRQVFIFWKAEFKITPSAIVIDKDGSYKNFYKEVHQDYIEKYAEHFLHLIGWKEWKVFPKDTCIYLEDTYLGEIMIGFGRIK